MIDVKEATRLMADAAEAQGADGNDSNGVVREIVLAHGLGFNAWFVVCCELADRSAQREGYANQSDRAVARMRRPALSKLAADREVGETEPRTEV